MKSKSAIKDSPIYKYRYHWAIAFLVFFGLFVTTYNFWNIPYGLTSSEIASATASSRLANGNIINSLFSSPSNIIDLPWHALQLLSIKIFGLSAFSVRLPAVILSLLAVLAVVLLVKYMFKASLAMMAGLILVSSAHFISIARSGTTDVMNLLLLTSAILVVAQILASKMQNNYLVILLAILLALLSYSKAGLIMVTILAIAGWLHPGIRLWAKDNKYSLLLGIGIYLLFSAPLIAILATDVFTLNAASMTEILGIGSLSLDNFAKIGQIFIYPHTDLSDGLLVPIVTIVSGLLALAGFVLLCLRDKASMKFSLLAFSLLGIILYSFVSPRFFTETFLFILILQVVCLDYLTSKWYGLFPRNPYARTFGIIPIAILLISISVVDYSRYFMSISYNSAVANKLDGTLWSLDSALMSGHGANDTILLTPRNRVDLYRQIGHGVTVKDVDQLSSKDIAKILADKNNRVIYVGEYPQQKKIISAAKAKTVHAGWQKDSPATVVVLAKKDK